METDFVDDIEQHLRSIVSFIERQKHIDYIKSKIVDLIELFGAQDNDEMVRRMKAIVPEFISNNSQFEKLDI